MATSEDIKMAVDTGPATRMKGGFSLGAYPACDFRADTDDSRRCIP